MKSDISSCTGSRQESAVVLALSYLINLQQLEASTAVRDLVPLSQLKKAREERQIFCHTTNEPGMRTPTRPRSCQQEVAFHAPEPTATKEEEFFFQRQPHPDIKAVQVNFMRGLLKKQVTLLSDWTEAAQPTSKHEEKFSNYKINYKKNFSKGQCSAMSIVAVFDTKAKIKLF